MAAACLSCLLAWVVGPGRAEAPDSTSLQATVRSLDGGDLNARDKVIRSLAARGLEARREIDEILETGSWWAREGALEALAGMGQAGLPTLVRVAESDPRVEARRFATRMIGKVRVNDAREALFRLMAQAQVRDVAAAALGDLGDTLAVPGLARALAGDHRPSVRRASAGSLGRLQVPDAYPALARGVQDVHHSVRSASARALGALGPPGAAAVLRILRHPDAIVRALAVETFGRACGRAGVATLASALKDPDWGVRGAAALGLGLSGGVGEIALLRDRLAREPDGFVRRRISEALLAIEGRP